MATHQLTKFLNEITLLLLQLLINDLVLDVKPAPEIIDLICLFGQDGLDLGRARLCLRLGGCKLFIGLSLQLSDLVENPVAELGIFFAELKHYVSKLSHFAVHFVHLPGELSEVLAGIVHRMT